MKSEIDTTLLLFLYQNLLTCTLYLERNCLYICSVYKINGKSTCELRLFPILDSSDPEIHSLYSGVYSQGIIHIRDSLAKICELYRYLYNGRGIMTIVSLLQ